MDAAMDVTLPGPWGPILDLLTTALGAMFFLFLPIELWRRWRSGALNKRSVLEMLASASPLIPTVLSATLVLSFIVALYTFIARYALWAIPINGWSILLAIIVVDFLYYWDHRCAHIFRPYWAIAHSVHHSSHQYDQTIGLRISFVDGFISPWFYLPALLIGFDPMLVLAALGFILAYQQWIHTEAVGKLAWFDGWLNTPSNHRVHHGVQQQYLDKNFGAVLMVWDRLFGTYQAEVEQVNYGLTTPLDSINPWHIHTREAVRWIKDVYQAPTVQEAWRRTFRVAEPVKYAGQDVESHPLK
jgi:sterol desaturase/sphingolipid hydroxylase (fatty acid hydroxylase superfamily)